MAAREARATVNKDGGQGGRAKVKKDGGQVG